MKPKEVVFISGKGGAGKTSLMAAVSELSASGAVLADCDVDAADLFLLARPENESSEPFFGMEKATVEESLCRGCGKCVRFCRFDAFIKKPGRVYQVDPSACQGCSRCADVCPVQAITMKPVARGEIILGNTRFGSALIYGVLKPGEENSGKLVTQVRQKARQKAIERGISLILSDGPPGVGCPAIAASGHNDLAVLICEGTLPGFHDAKRALELLKKMGTPAAAVINKSGLYPALDHKIEEWLSENQVPLLARFPFSKTFVQALKKGESPLSLKEFQKEFEKFYHQILNLIKEQS